MKFENNVTNKAEVLNVHPDHSEFERKRLVRLVEAFTDSRHCSWAEACQYLDIDPKDVEDL